MKALMVRENGALRFEDRALPKEKPGRIRVNVEYIGVGFADAMAVRGGYALAPQKPFSPGYEFLGSVEGTGQRVAGMVPHMGCYQEILDIDSLWAVPVPEGLSSEKAAAVPLNYLTAWALLRRMGQLQKGDAFLIHGAAGGVGSATLELARGWGFRGFGTVSAGKEADVEALGATALPRGDRWPDLARRLEPRGFQAAFDSFGGTLLRQSFRSLAPGGTLVSYGFAPTLDGGNGPLIDGLLFHARMKLAFSGRRTVVCGTPSIIDRDRKWYRETLDVLFREAAASRISPKVFEVLPWDQAVLAHRLILEGKVRGKILLKVC